MFLKLLCIFSDNKGWGPGICAFNEIYSWFQWCKKIVIVLILQKQENWSTKKLNNLLGHPTDTR